MKKIKKIKLLEIIILIIISISLVVIVLLAHTLLGDKPQTASPSQVINYKKSKITKYSKISNEALVYNIPLVELINFERSTYDIYLSSTDNIITELTEIIKINYYDIPSELNNNIINYCNSYDSIESKYKLRCRFKNNTLYIKNSFSIDQLKDNLIKTSNLEIKIPVTYNSKLNEFLNYLSSQSIEFYEVDEIQE